MDRNCIQRNRGLDKIGSGKFNHFIEEEGVLHETNL